MKCILNSIIVAILSCNAFLTIAIAESFSDGSEDALEYYKRLRFIKDSIELYPVTTELEFFSMNLVRRDKTDLVRFSSYFPQLPNGQALDLCAQRECSCAVVGNSRNLLGSGYGNLIDSNQVIFRMNNAPLKGYEEDVGTRTDVSLFQNFQGRPFRYGAHTRNILIVNDTGTSLDPRAYLGRVRSVLRPLIEEQREAAIQDKYVPIVDFSQSMGRTYLYSPVYLDWINRFLFTPEGRDPITHPSTGIKAIFFALKYCKTINLFGFGFNKENSSWDHYYDFQNTKLYGSPFKIHRWDFQLTILEYLSDFGIVDIFEGNTGRDALEMCRRPTF